MEAAKTISSTPMVENTAAPAPEPQSVIPRVWVTVFGLILVLNSFVVGWIFTGADAVAAFSAMLGAIILGWPIVLTSLRDLRAGLLRTNELVAIAVLASFASGHYQEAGIIALFMLFGEIIETRTAEGARRSIESLIKLAPGKARRVTADGEVEIEVSRLAVDDIIRVRPGDNVAADGIVVTGQGSINQANITGESLPVDKKAGDEVFAGTQNLTGVLEVRVTRAGQDTTLGRVRELILSAQGTKLPIMRIVDQYMGYYTPLVLVIGAVVWAFTLDFSRVIAVFIVACPGAFILATPTAMVAALSAAARLGILIKNVGDIELAARINAFVFDKTGTLTQGPARPRRRRPAGGTAARRRLGGEIQQPPDGEGARRAGGAGGRDARRAEGFCRDGWTRREGDGQRRDSDRGPRAMAARQRSDGGIHGEGGPARGRRLQPAVRGERRALPRLARVAG